MTGPSSSTRSRRRTLSWWPPGGWSSCASRAIRDDLVVIHLLQVPIPLRRNGIGSQTLGDLTAAADRNGWILAGTPDTSFGSSRAGLHRLYRRFGFTSNRGRHADFTISESLARQPPPTPSSTSGMSPADLDRAAALEATERRGPDRQKHRVRNVPGPPRPALRPYRNAHRCGCG